MLRNRIIIRGSEMRRCSDGHARGDVQARDSFSLVAWFALLGLVCVAVAAVASASLLTRFMAHRMLEQDAQVSADFIESIVRAERSWPDFATSSSAGLERSGLASFFNHVSELPDVVRANIYGADTQVLWSSDSRLIGRRLGTNPELEAALAGKILVASGVAGQGGKAEHLTLGVATQGRRFVEAYLPVWNERRTRVVGVVEIYKLPVLLFRTIDEGVRMVWVGALAVSLFLYASLFWIVRRADWVMRIQRQRLVEAETLATVGAFASAVAHGIRNPLAIIRSSAELAQGERDEAVREETLAELLRQTDRLESWVRDLMLSARGEAVEAGAVDVAALISEAAQGFASAAEQRGVRLSLRAEGLPPARGERGPLARALENVISNAIEAMPDGGTLRIEGGAAGAPRGGGGAGGPGTVEIRVADSGRGLPPDLAQRVARPFFSTKPRGTGLGLALARRIVASYGGTLCFETTEGRGSTVTIRLPVAAG
jgi:signal transduction histidine kinase